MYETLNSFSVCILHDVRHSYVYLLINDRRVVKTIAIVFMTHIVCHIYVNFRYFMTDDNKLMKYTNRCSDAFMRIFTDNCH